MKRLKFSNVVQCFIEVKNLHLGGTNQPGAISGLEPAQAVDAISSLLTEAAFGWRRSPLLLVQGQTLHTAVHLHTAHISVLLIHIKL